MAIYNFTWIIERANVTPTIVPDSNGQMNQLEPPGIGKVTGTIYPLALDRSDLWTFWNYVAGAGEIGLIIFPVAVKVIGNQGETIRILPILQATITILTATLEPVFGWFTAGVIPAPPDLDPALNVHPNRTNYALSGLQEFTGDENLPSYRLIVKSDAPNMPNGFVINAAIASYSAAPGPLNIAVSLEVDTSPMPANAIIAFDSMAWTGLAGPGSPWPGSAENMYRLVKGLPGSNPITMPLGSGANTTMKLKLQ